MSSFCLALQQAKSLRLPAPGSKEGVFLGSRARRLRSASQVNPRKASWEARWGVGVFMGPTNKHGEHGERMGKGAVILVCSGVTELQGSVCSKMEALNTNRVEFQPLGR